MKRILSYIIAITAAVIFFYSCNLFVSDKDAFDFGDTVNIAIGETLYESDSLWVRLDSIIEDSRCPMYLSTADTGRVVAWFSFGINDTVQHWMFSTDSIRARVIWEYPDSRFSTMGFPSGMYFWFTIVNVLPYRVMDEIIRERDYRISFVMDPDVIIILKPNIYLYPKLTTKLDVSLEFPLGGEVTVSDPAYPEMWQDIKVTPSGKINREHDFLFYEAALPDKWQYDEGWSVKQGGLRIFFEDNLKDYGFNMREIADFTEYWIPRLKNSPYYVIYPQHTAKIDEVVTLDISKTPRSIFRLFYVIKEIPEFEDMFTPHIPDFERTGFTVTEWGVVLKK